MSRPTLTIIAGANGAGKSTLTAGSPGTFGAIPLLDPDAFANIIHRELGVYGLARFLRVYRAGIGDYTRDRHQWLEGLTVHELAKEFEGRQS